MGYTQLKAVFSTGTQNSPEPDPTIFFQPEPDKEVNWSDRARKLSGRVGLGLGLGPREINSGARHKKSSRVKSVHLN